MKISVISFTLQGGQLAGKIKASLSDWEVELYRKPEQGLVPWVGEQFAEGSAIVFIGACGIAVRAIAPHIKDKLSDSPVLVLDERGRYVIPILSGHVGGANALAGLIADRTGATAVITTATDINGLFAVDLFAQRNGLRILDKGGIAKVSAKLLRGEKLIFSIEDYDKRIKPDKSLVPEGIGLAPYPPGQDVDVVISAAAGWEDSAGQEEAAGREDAAGWEDAAGREDVAGREDAEGREGLAGRAALRLAPREYVLGIGCRKGKTKEEIAGFILSNLAKLGLESSDIALIASIDRKKGEEGICRWAEENRVPYVTFPEEELKSVEGDFHGSGFVERTVGVDNVCERAAVLACGPGGRLVLAKQAQDGMTLAVAKKEWKIGWEW